METVERQNIAKLRLKLKQIIQMTVQTQAK